MTADSIVTECSFRIIVKLSRCKPMPKTVYIKQRDQIIQANQRQDAIIVVCIFNEKEL